MRALNLAVGLIVPAAIVYLVARHPVKAVAALLSIGVLAGCGGVDRHTCLAEASATKLARAKVECSGLYWSECPARERIQDDFERRATSCP